MSAGLSSHQWSLVSPSGKTATVLLQSTFGLRILGSGQRAEGQVLQRCLEKMERGVVMQGGGGACCQP